MRLDRWGMIPITLDRHSRWDCLESAVRSWEADAVEWFDARADWNAHRRDELHPTRQRLFYYFHLLAGGGRESQRDAGWSDTQQLFRRLYTGSVARRRNY